MSCQNPGSRGGLNIPDSLHRDAIPPAEQFSMYWEPLVLEAFFKIWERSHSMRYMWPRDGYDYYPYCMLTSSAFDLCNMILSPQSKHGGSTAKIHHACQWVHKVKRPTFKHCDIFLNHWIKLGASTVKNLCACQWVHTVNWQVLAQ